MKLRLGLTARFNTANNRLPKESTSHSGGWPGMKTGATCAFQASTSSGWCQFMSSGTLKVNTTSTTTAMELGSSGSASR